MSEPVLLQAEAVTRAYTAENRPALQSVSFSLQAGDFLVITGPSGSGKSTLLNIAGGLDKPTNGQVRYHGDDLHALDESRLAELRNGAFGFVFQTPHLLMDRTVLENVALPFKYGREVDVALVRERAIGLINYVGLADMIDRYPNTLSGGEMQRVVFARALAREPDIVFADEPTGSLDADNSQRLLELLKDQASRGRAVIMATHDPEAMSYGSRHLRLNKFQPEATKEGRNPHAGEEEHAMGGHTIFTVML